MPHSRFCVGREIGTFGQDIAKNSKTNMGIFTIDSKCEKNDFIIFLGGGSGKRIIFICKYVENNIV